MKVLNARNVMQCSMLVASLLICTLDTSAAPAKMAVVGAGPAGIIAVAVLLEAGIAAADIVWIDPEFAVGRIGKYYRDVPANNKAKRFIEFIEMSKVFRELSSASIERLYTLDPEREYSLSYIIDPLQDFTDYYISKVRAVHGRLTQLTYVNDAWVLDAEGVSVTAERVILALGSHPRELSYAVAPSQQVIPLDEALQPHLLPTLVNVQDTVAVFGGAHSAVLVMKWLIDAGVGRIINFYRHPLWYLSVEEQAARRCISIVGDPLSGLAAAWAREVLDANPPANLLRMKSSEAAVRAWLPLCTKIIYALGYDRNEMPEMVGASTDTYNPATGIIGPHLFGMGIAFPELTPRPDGSCKCQIGLRDFMRFAQRMIPEWLRRDASDTVGLLEDMVTVTVL